MFLPKVSDFVEFLSAQEHSVDEILAHITLRVFSPLNVCTAFMVELNENNLIETLGTYGAGMELEDQYPDLYSFNENLPIPDAMRNRKVVWINNLPKWPSEYPGLKGKPAVKGTKTFICFPIEKSGTPVAAIGVFSNSEIHPNNEVEEFLKAIGNLISLHLYRRGQAYRELSRMSQNFNSPAIGMSSRPTKLSYRQMLILRMMSEGRTNLVISELLGYSESTVRQETIKIFAILGCHGREEASKIYREKFANLSLT